MFWVYLKNLSIPKNLRTLETNFEEADGLGISVPNRSAGPNKRADGEFLENQ